MCWGETDGLLAEATVSGHGVESFLNGTEVAVGAVGETVWSTVEQGGAGCVCVYVYCQHIL